MLTADSYKEAVMNVDLGPEETATLHCEGELNISRAAELRTAMLSAFELGSKKVVLDFSKVESIDLACMQLVCSAHKTALKKEASLDVSPESVPLLKKAAFLTGFQRDTGCVTSCIWSAVKKAA